MKPGDIVLLSFPQADLSAGKLRPALVVALAPGRHPDVLLSLITSWAYQEIPDFTSSGLKVRSFIRLARLVSVDMAVINARLGEISPERLRRVKERLADWLKNSKFVPSLFNMDERPLPAAKQEVLDARERQEVVGSVVGFHCDGLYFGHRL